MTDYILAPMQLDAMVLNEKTTLTTPFLRFNMQYSQLKTFNTADPAPFDADTDLPPSAGIYLTWTLPKALRNSIPKEDGTSDFPLIPNRFLVARVQAGASPETALKAWVLESDFLSSDASSDYVDPFVLDANGAPIATKIGRVRELETIDTLYKTPEPFLRASGPGTSTFSVYSPGVDNVLAFYDDVSGLDNATFSYYVAGWFGNPEDDPLQNSEWRITEEGAETYINTLFDWMVYSNTDAIPKNMLITALVSGVPWNRQGDSPVPPTYPEKIAESVKVGFGNTSTDALAAINANMADTSTQSNAHMLAAFQYNALDLYDQTASASQLNSEMRTHWYGSSSGGTLWVITPQETEQSTALPASDPPKTTPEQKSALDTLNLLQRSCDKENRKLNAMQYTLYTLWWKDKWQEFKFDNPVPVSTTYAEFLSVQLPLQVYGDGSDKPWYCNLVKNQIEQVTALQEEVNTAKETMQSLLDPSTQWLKETSMPDYYYANDPVLLASGLGKATNYDPTGTLTCRYIDQTVNSITINGTTYVINGATEANQINISNQIPILADPQGILPNGIDAINNENFFLSPQLFAEDILGDPAKTEDVEAAIADLPAPGADNRFPPESFARPTWAQPWIPLLLDWRVTLFKEPAYLCDKDMDTAKFLKENWTFDGTDYIWTGPTAESEVNYNEAASKQMELEGRTFVGPYTSSTLADQVETLNKSLTQHQPNTQNIHSKLQSNIQDISTDDLLSQRLSGLSAQMVQRNFNSNVAPGGDIAELLGDTYQGYSKPFPAKQSTSSPVAWDFSPMRGTFLVVNDLTVIDSFGRSVDLMQANYSTYPHNDPESQETYFYPIADIELKSSTTVDPYPGIEAASSPTYRMLKLTPRMIQDAQVSFNLTANNETNEEIDVSANNPVCGWLVPNHLNRSLAVYAPEGVAWGEVYLSKQGDGTFIPIWQPCPTNEDDSPKTVEEIPNIYVRELLDNLMTRDDNGQSFNDFIQAIDETLWTVDPEGQSGDDLLNVLIGRPLAVVRSNLSLKLKGFAYVNQDWWNTFDVSESDLPEDWTEPAVLANVNGGILDYEWEVRLGSQELTDDGLIGYYLDDPNDENQTFNTFNCVHLPDTVRSDYLKKIEPGNYINLRFIDDSIDTPNPKENQITYVTMLVDPRAGCHAYTGILPVYNQLIPDEFVTPSLETLSYLFRAGPIITPPNETCIPKPAEDQGIWSWYDKTTKENTPISSDSTKVRYMSPPPLFKQGWLKFTPDINNSETKDPS